MKKKKSSKKPSKVVRKKPSKKSSKKRVRRVSANKAFWLKSDHGKVVDVCHSIKELADTVEKSPNSVFSFHTNGRNDFASWIESVFNKKGLAEKVYNVKTKKKFLEALRGEVE